MEIDVVSHHCHDDDTHEQYQRAKYPGFGSHAPSAQRRPRARSPPLSGCIRIGTTISSISARRARSSLFLDLRRSISPASLMPAPIATNMENVVESATPPSRAITRALRNRPTPCYSGGRDTRPPRTPRHPSRTSCRRNECSDSSGTRDALRGPSGTSRPSAGTPSRASPPYGASPLPVAPALLAVSAAVSSCPVSSRHVLECPYYWSCVLECQGLRGTIMGHIEKNRRKAGMMIGVDEEYYTLDEVAERLKVSRRTVNRWVEAQTLPVIRLSANRGSVRVSGDDLHRFLNERRTKPREIVEEE